MMSYIFDCDGFVPTARGGTFRKGHRRLAFACSSERVNARISQLVKGGLEFPADALPDNVIHVLHREGVLRPHDPYAPCRVAANRPDANRWHRLDAALRAALPVNAYTAYVLLQMRTSSIRMALTDTSSVVILDRPIVAAAVRRWAALTSPSVLAVLAIIDLVWLLTTSPRVYLIRPGSILREPAVDQFVILALTLVLILVHELAHAASAQHRTGDAGQIRFGRMLCCIPYVFTAIPRLGEASQRDRFEISASGIVVQLALSIALLTGFREFDHVRTAAALSMTMALFNLLPIWRLDGYWMICDLVGRPLRLTLHWSKARIGDACYTMAIAALLVVGLAALLALRARQ